MPNSQIIPGGFPIPALATVAVDNVTIVGSGTERDPLRTVSQNVNTITRPNPGQLINLGNAINTNGQKPIATTDVNTAAVLGLAVALPDATHVTYQRSGVVTLTTAQWDTVAGTSGGLTAGNYYYLSKDTNGALVSPAPVAAGSFAVPIGIALSATQLQLQLGAPVGPHA